VRNSTDTKTLIPVDAVTKITEHEVFIDPSRERVAGAPDYDPDLVGDRPYHASIYNHYGYEPYWGQGYMDPPGPRQSRVSAGQDL